MAADNDLHVPTEAERDDPQRAAKGPRLHLAHEKKVKAEKEKPPRG